MAPPRDVDDWAAVESLEDFVVFLRLLGENFERAPVEPYGGGDWESGTIDQYLDALSAMIEGNFLDADAPRAAERPEPSWQTFARLLWAARSYE